MSGSLSELRFREDIPIPPAALIAFPIVGTFPRHAVKLRALPRQLIANPRLRDARFMIPSSKSRSPPQGGEDETPAGHHEPEKFH